MKTKLTFAVTLLLALAIGLLAADVSGKWTAKVPARDGTRDATFTFKVEGDKVTGTMSGGQGGDVAIADGKVTGDTISFKVTSQRGERTYTGTIAGDEIKFKTAGGQGQAREFVANRAK